MFSFSDLDISLVAAPMAGGPSTPELAAAVSEAGGLGLLAGGYLSAEALTRQIQQTRALTSRTFGVNLFMPITDEQIPEDAGEQLARFTSALQPVAEYLGSEPGEAQATGESESRVFTELMEVVISHRIAVVTFTFGCPSADLMQLLQESGSLVGVTVTRPQDALTAEQAGADFLCVQGPAAGGHQSTFSVTDELNELPLPRLLEEVRRICTVPLVAAGGVRKAEQVQSLLASGAVAVQLGTLLLLADEAGTSEPHRNLLQAPARETQMTRAFTGRFARAIRNSWVERHHDTAPALYPGVHEVTGPLRRAAALRGDTEWIQAWAGEPYAGVRGGPAAEILRNLVSAR